MRKLRRFLEPLRRQILGELVGDPGTLIVDSTLLSVRHPRQVGRSASGFDGAAWSRWGSFYVYGVKLHLSCSKVRVPLSYELTAANTADVLLVEELLAVADLGEGGVGRGLFGDLAYKSTALRRLAESGVLLATEGASRRPERGYPSVRQQVEVCFAHLKCIFGLGETSAKTLVRLAIRIAAKLTAYTYAMYINRLLGARSQQALLKAMGRERWTWSLLRM